jgi:outer membrane biosynthesis protein TonB
MSDPSDKGSDPREWRFEDDLLAILVTVVLHVALFLWMDIERGTTSHTDHLRHLREAAARDARDVAVQPAEQKGIVVEFLPPPDQKKPPKEARFLGREDASTDRETRARERVREKTPTPPSPVAAPDATRPGAPKKADTPPKAPARVATRSPGSTVNRLSVPTPGAERSVLFQRPGSGPVRPTGTAEELADVSSDLVGDGLYVAGVASDDALLDVADEGDRTSLNTRGFRYWDFFHRVREQVKQHWSPNEEYQRRDPTWSIYQRQNRLTVVRVVLDGQGNVVSVARVRKSGLVFLDDEAVRAFQAAGPFLNPPAGLADDSGRIVFNFGFYLELDGSFGGSW